MGSYLCRLPNSVCVCVCVGATLCQLPCVAHTERHRHTQWPQSAVRYDWHPAARTFAGLAAAAAAAVADRQLNSYRQYKYFI